MGKNDYHVTKRPDGDWQYKLPGAKRASGVTDTQSESEIAAKDIARRNGGGEITIHGLDGRIRDRDTIPPANDPHPPKDMRH